MPLSPLKRRPLFRSATAVFFCAFVAALPIMTMLNAAVLGRIAIACDAFFALAILCFLLGLMTGQVKLQPGRFYIPLALYFLSLLVSTLFSENVGGSARKLIAEIYLLSIGIVTYNLVGSVGSFRSVSRAWMAGTAVTVLASIAGILLFYAGVRDDSVNVFLRGYGSLPAGNYPRVGAFFFNFNMLSNYLIVSFVLLLVMHATGAIRRSIYLPLLAGIGITALFTFSLGIGGIVLAAGLWLWLATRGTERQMLGRWLLSGYAAISMLFLVAAAISPDLEGPGGAALPLTEKRLHPSSRLLVWRSALATFGSHPISGKGLGEDIAKVDYVTVSGETQELRDAHNVWLSIAGQQGILGLIGFGSLAVFLLSGIRPWRVRGDPDAVIRTGLAIAFAAACLYHGLSGSFEDARHLWVVIGILAAAKQTKPSLH